MRPRISLIHTNFFHCFFSAISGNLSRLLGNLSRSFGISSHSLSTTNCTDVHEFPSLFSLVQFPVRLRRTGPPLVCILYFNSLLFLLCVLCEKHLIVLLCGLCVLCEKESFAYSANSARNILLFISADFAYSARKNSLRTLRTLRETSYCSSLRTLRTLREISYCSSLRTLRTLRERILCVLCGLCEKHLIVHLCGLCEKESFAYSARKNSSPPPLAGFRVFC